jgi:hypothetical protein
MIAFCMVFRQVMQTSTQEVFDEMCLEKRLDLDLVCDQIDLIVEQGQDWDIEHSFYIKAIQFNMDVLNAVDMTHAVAYDDNLNPLTAQSYLNDQDDPFDPLLYPEFLDAIKQNDRGEMILRQESEAIGVSEMYLYYRWVPTSRELEGRFLTVIAISTDAVHIGLFSEIDRSVVAIIITTTVLNVCLVALLCSLGNVYVGRKGKQKWRSKEDMQDDT